MQTEKHRNRGIEMCGQGIQCEKERNRIKAKSIIREERKRERARKRET